MVRFPGPEQFSPSAIVVFARQPDGKLWELNPTDQSPLIWSSYSQFPAVTSIVVANYEPAASDAVADARPPEIRAGYIWEGAEKLAAKRIHSGLSTEVGLRAFASVTEYLAEGGMSSLLSSNRGVVNWQGDLLALAVPALQALTGTLLLWLTYPGLTATGRQIEYGASQAPASFSILAVPFVMLCMILVFLLGHQLSVYFRAIIHFSAASETLIGHAAVIIPGLLLWLWVTRCVNVATSSRQLWLLMLSLILAASLLKLYWLRGINFHPVSDYESYLRLGTLAAEGRWEEIGQDKYPSATTLLRRAITFVSPIVYCFGRGLWKIEAANVVAQAISALLVCVLIRRMHGLRAAACSLPFILLYPEFFYSSGMVSHNVWGYLWIPAAWLVYDTFLRNSTNAQSENRPLWIRLLMAVGWGLAFGLCTAFVELTKSYGSLMLIAIILHLVAGPRVYTLLTGLPATLTPPIALRVVFLIALLCVYRPFVQQVDSRLLAYSGLKKNPHYPLELMASMTSTAFAVGNNHELWMLDYYAGTPEGNKRGVVTRQLLYEKLANFGGFLISMLDKNRKIAFCSDAMVMLQDDLPASGGRYRQRRMINFRTGILQGTLCELLGALLALLCLIRCLTGGRRSVAESELLPLISTAAVLATIFLLTESHRYYTQNLGYPFCWSAGLLTSWIRPIGPANLSMRLFLRRMFGPQTLASFVALVILIGSGCLLGQWFDQSGLSFRRLREAEKATASGSPDVSATASLSRLHGGITLNAVEAIIPAGTKVSGSFDVLPEAQEPPGIRFFISGNQRAFGRRIESQWNGLPIRFTVELNGKTVRSGSISRLQQAVFVELPSKFWSDQRRTDAQPQPLRISLTLEVIRDCRRPRRGPQPALAVEYIN